MSFLSVRSYETSQPRKMRLARGFVLFCSLALVSGCSTTDIATSAYAPMSISLPAPQSFPDGKGGFRPALKRSELQQFDYATIYSGMNDDGTVIPAFDYTKMSARYLRQEVNYFGPEAKGTIIVDARRRHLYLVLGNRKAMRYGIAVGKEGFGWTGNSRLEWKQKWPTWTPPPEMIERKPHLKKYADGLKGSPSNPLGARAMYLYKNGKDTLYRIHGTDKPHTIGLAASSGCFRMINQDVIDLYDRVGVKGSVQVKPQVDLAMVEGGR